MKTMHKLAALAAIIVFALAYVPCPTAFAAGLDTAMIERVSGMKGSLDAKEGVYKIMSPRSDLKVNAGGVKITPPLGLTSWAGFTKSGDMAMVMGDLVLTEDQVNPVMSEALDSGLSVTALHNHFMMEKPRIMFMHISGMGTESDLVGAVKKVFERIDKTKGGKGEFPKANIDPAKTKLDTTKIDAALGAKGSMGGGVYKFVFGRKAMMGDTEIGGAMGVNTWAAFAGTDKKAVVDGDFAVHEDELQGVLKALRGAGIYIAASHSHMTGEQPRTLFLHYWGIGPAEDLAKGLKGALGTLKGE